MAESTQVDQVRELQHGLTKMQLEMAIVQENIKKNEEELLNKQEESMKKNQVETMRQIQELWAANNKHKGPQDQNVT